jgi:hypothetical protein
MWSWQWRRMRARRGAASPVTRETPFGLLASVHGHSSRKLMSHVYSNSVRTSQETHCTPAIKTVRLLLFGEIITVYCETDTEHTNTPCGQNAVFNVKADGTHGYRCALKGSKGTSPSFPIHCSLHSYINHKQNNHDIWRYRGKLNCRTGQYSISHRQYQYSRNLLIPFNDTVATVDPGFDSRRYKIF